MEKKSEDCKDMKKSPKVKPLIIEDSNKEELNGGTVEGEETEALLPPRKDGLLKKSGKPRLSVQWNDRDGSNLTEVLEFQPSDVSDSDDEDSDSCLCIIM